MSSNQKDTLESNKDLDSNEKVEAETIEAKDKAVLYIVIPCYNEEAVLTITSTLFLNKIKHLVNINKISNKSKILFVDDGSTDSTWEIINILSRSDNHFCGIKQSRNRGHQSSLLAGLMEVRDKADVAISIDCDGQDDINAIDDMLDRYYEGFDIVYGVRDNRDTDTPFKRNTAQLFYKILNKLGAETVYNHADYRLTSSRVLNELSNYSEVNLYLRGIFPLIGFKSTTVKYSRKERIAGKSHYPLGKMLNLAINGITNLSTKPIRIITMLGLAISVISFATIIWVLIGLINGSTVQGWASTLGILSLFCGIQLISIGVIGEYIGKIYMETKHRPRYIISERTETLEK